MAGLSRRTTIGLTAAAALAPLSACQDAPDAGADGRRKCAITEKTLRDRLRGMILVSAYGDALGAPWELRGLRGEVGSTADGKTLRPLADYGRDGESASPFGVWIDPRNPANRRKTGLPTDDTSIRVALVHPWLCEVAGGRGALNEASFYDYLGRQRAPKPDDTEWETTRRKAAEAIRCMMEDAATLKRVGAGAFRRRPCNRFFFADQPIIFGPFLYLELNALFLCCDRKEVFRRASGFTGLDIGYGRYVSGLLGAVMSRTICGKKPGEGFFDFFFREMDAVFDAGYGAAGDRRMVRREVDDARRIGLGLTPLDEDDFLRKLKDLVFDAPRPKEIRPGFGNYDPLKFLRMFAAVVAYAGDDVAKALRLLACSVGDSDTMPALLGAIIGAWCGETELAARYPAMKTGMTQVGDCLKKVGGVDIDKLIACQIALAKKVGCCEIRAG